jgi:DNA-binding HxlR family transcriptional regulator
VATHLKPFNEVPPRVEYALTALGHSLRPLVSSLCRWAIANVDEVMTARSRFSATTRE